MPVERIVVEVHLRVERQQLAVFGHDQRVDLDQRGVGRAERIPEGVHELRGLRDRVPFQTERERQLPRLKRAQAGSRVDELLEDLFGRLVGDFLDLHAAFGADHDHRTFGRAVDNHPEIQLALDLEPLLDEHALHFLACRPRLVGHELHADHVCGGRLCLIGVLDDLDAAAFATTAGMDLCLDDNDAATQPARRLAGLRAAEHDFSLRHRYAVARQDRLRLILVDFHGVEARFRRARKLLIMSQARASKQAR